jgi:hypothetical protein
VRAGVRACVHAFERVVEGEERNRSYSYSFILTGLSPRPALSFAFCLVLV